MFLFFPGLSCVEHMRAVASPGRRDMLGEIYHSSLQEAMMKVSKQSPLVGQKHKLIEFETCLKI